MPYPIPHPEESLGRLRRSGWWCGQDVFADASGQTVYQVDGCNGDTRICVEGASSAEAWHLAVLAAAACGMLAEEPMPKSGRVT